MKNYRALIFIIFSILGIVSSSISIIVLNYSNTSWNYFLTENPDEQFSTCAMSENGNFVVVGSGNDFLYLFKDDVRVPLWSYKMEDDVVSVDISANGDYIVACDCIGNVLLFSRRYPVPIWSFKGNQHSIAKISANGKYVAFLNLGSLYFYSREENQILWSYAFNVEGYCIDISDDGNEIVVCTDGILCYFEKSKSSPIWQYDAKEFMNALVISPCGELIAFGGQNQRVDLFSNSSSVPFRTYHTSSIVHSISISKDKSEIAVLCNGGCYLYNTDDETYLWGYFIGSESSQVALSSDGNFIISGDTSFDEELSILHCLIKGQNIPLWSIKVKGMINKIAISNDGNSIGVATQQFFYFIDRSNPIIFEWQLFLLNLNCIGLIISVGSALISGVLILYNLCTKKLISEIQQERKSHLRLNYCPICNSLLREQGQEFCESCGSELI